MRKKDDIFSKLLEFKVLVEKETGKKVKALSNDNGAEFMSNEFKKSCAKEGIQQELKSPHNPQQNELFERKNQRILGEEMAMLHDQSLPLRLWVEACNIVVYLQSRIPH